MNTFRLSIPPLLAAFGTAVLLTGIGLAASRPVQSAAGPIPITIANSPLPTTAADDHDRQDVQFNGLLQIVDGGNSDYNDTSCTVPAGKRLVIETGSARASYGDTKRYSVSVFSNGGVAQNSARADFGILPDGAPFPIGSAHIHQYADAGSAVSVFLYRTSNGGCSFISSIVTGCLVDAP